MSNDAIISFIGVISNCLLNTLYCNIVGMFVIFINNHAPANDANIACMPNLTNTVLLV
jgi:hypothetical protein